MTYFFNLKKKTFLVLLMIVENGNLFIQAITKNLTRVSFVKLYI